MHANAAQAKPCMPMRLCKQSMHANAAGTGTRSARPGWCGGVGQRAWRPARWAAGCVGAETPTLLPKAASCQAVLKSPLGFSACGRVRVVTSAALLPQPRAQVKAEIQALSSFGFQYLSHQVRRGARSWLHSRCGRSRGCSVLRVWVGGWGARVRVRPRDRHRSHVAVRERVAAAVLSASALAA